MVGTKDQEFLKFGKWGAHGTLGGASNAENSKGGVKIKSLPGGGGLKSPLKNSERLQSWMPRFKSLKEMGPQNFRPGKEIRNSDP